jgi:uncharacterized protein YcbX
VTESTPAIAVAALFVHPIKSAGRIAVDSLELDARGACGDRRWMLVNERGVAITQRDHRRLALVQPSFASVDREGALVLRAPQMEPFTLVVPPRAVVRRVQVWDDETTALDAGDRAAEWMSDAIGAHCRVVRLAPGARRPLAARNAGEVPATGRDVAFPDAAPLLLLGQASIDALNVRLRERGEKPVSDERFRPNVLLAGTEPHEEDGWSLVEIGAVTVGVGRPCARCVMTTIDQFTAEQGIEPLRTMSTYRKRDGKVLFAVNATNAAPGTINMGDALRVLSRQSEMRASPG